MWSSTTGQWVLRTDIGQEYGRFAAREDAIAFLKDLDQMRAIGLRVIAPEMLTVTKEYRH